MHDMLADHSGREVEPLGRRDEAAGVDHLPKNLDAGEGIHAVRSQWLRDKSGQPLP